MRRLLPLLALSAALISTAAIAAPRACPVGLHPATTAEVYFGGDIGQVSDADWRQFVGAEVKPRFPDGLAASDVYGQWQNSKGAFVREQTMALFLVLNGDPGERERIDLLRDAYKQRFRQDSVVVVDQQACIAF
jgi:hypothetical protein